ncbi:MAG TPA: pseudouridine-5'-phosphate glycosidase [Candidatus Cloacimonas sp.]|jgi:pseudouridine-5'-phosphate glycosidase|nr:pseudouridine-5'-phosphate glycosidase [Candidatus Cloacimonas sp.]HNZ32926.1 pseudouridine-5'-phosphate glycosidase [Candidatus Cloacimonas sp.]HPH72149.1 pseudouridine-5'-phosphate glycosidase [Candidatus Cloacimonas sp.]HPV64906.1 pseudouridine-5'-phosphate glycosidase [Candidatus Cloacimonas sp.]HQB49346.1 pseudouridine-5'-phosphate glycosidase [Candidatus Cloacimonas sp.]
MHSLLNYSSRIKKALDLGKPILAMESTVLTHGLPYPDNLDILETLEELCYSLEVEPATIIVLDGQLHIGMDDQEKEILKNKLQHSQELNKFSMRDIPYAINYKKSGGTTVSATMLLSYKAGIRVFATGGIGGVHKSWNETLDISSDLKALSEIPIIVVSAGCKAILDIPATLEVLESEAVPVLGWKTNEFPAFYSQKSGKKIDKIESAKDVVNIYKTIQKLYPNPTGILVANPVPEKDQIPYKEIAEHIIAAIDEAKAKGISGKELTPFLLANLAEKTAGKSVQTNLALLKNNVLIGAQIAKELK